MTTQPHISGMTKRKPYKPAPDTSGRIVGTMLSVNGRHVEPGTELSIVGQRGRFRFVRVVTNASGARSIEVFGGKANHEKTRSFRPEQIKTVHRLKRTRS